MSDQGRNVVVHSGPHEYATFIGIARWRFDEDGSLHLLDATGGALAVFTRGAWTAVHAAEARLT